MIIGFVCYVYMCLFLLRIFMLIYVFYDIFMILPLMCITLLCIPTEDEAVEVEIGEVDMTCGRRR